MVRCSEVYQVNSGFLRKGIPENSRRQGNLRVGGFKAATSTYHKHLHFSADEFIAGLKRARCRLASPSWRACEQHKRRMDSLGAKHQGNRTGLGMLRSSIYGEASWREKYTETGKGMLYPLHYTASLGRKGLNSLLRLAL